MGKVNILTIAILLVACNQYQTFKLDEIGEHRIEIPKPTSIYYSSLDTAFYFATLDGVLAKADTNFHITFVRETPNESFKCVFVDEFFLYAVSKKDIIKFDKFSLEKKDNIPLNKLGLKQSSIRGFYFNPTSKTFDIVVQGKNLENMQFNPSNFKKVKTILIGKKFGVESSFQFHKYLYLIDNESKTLFVRDLTMNFKLVKSFKFFGVNFSSGTILPPSTIVLLSSETKRVFKYRFQP
ncbi:MAG: hypothetical protein ACPLX7_03785 [Candidatus Kapaibacteriota bacterium]